MSVCYVMYARGPERDARYFRSITQIAVQMSMSLQAATARQAKLGGGDGAAAKLSTCNVQYNV